MRIAVDARPLSAPLTGIGRYTHALLEAMVPRGHEWFLYSDRPLHVDPPEGAVLRHGNAVGGTAASLRWTQWHYARWAREDKVDLFWSPRHHLPLLLDRGIARVVTIHDLVWREFPDTMRRRNLLVERMLMAPSVRMADRVICVSRFTAGELTRFYPAAIGKCQVIHGAAQEHAVAGSPPAGTPDDYLLFVGTLEPRKNLPRLLQAYASLRHEADLPNLVIAGGSGWGGEDLPRMVEKLDLQQRVTLAGYVSEAELQALYDGAKVLLMPSIYEGFGLPVVEAMRHGVPSIVSTTGSLPEVAGDAALLVDPWSVDAIAEAILRLLREPGLRERLAANAAARAAEFCWQRAGDDTLALFEAVLEKRGGDAAMEKAGD